MPKKKKSYLDYQEQTILTGGTLSLLFRGLFALVPSKKLATNGNPSSVTMLFPNASAPSDMRAELGSGHTHYGHVPAATNFDPHNLYLHVGTISGNTFTITGSTPINHDSEIIFYDGTVSTANEINSPGLMPNDSSRTDPANSVDMRSIQDDGPVGSPNVINLHNIYQNEQDIDDRKLEANYLSASAAGLAGRVFRLYKGSLQGFAGEIYGPSAPDMTSQTRQECLSDPNICYFFDKHDGGRYPGNLDLVRRSVTDTLIFERTLVNSQVTVQVNGRELPFPVTGGKVCLLLQHIGPYRSVTSPVYDIDFALTYRSAKLDRNHSANRKERRIPKIDYCSAGGGGGEGGGKNRTLAVKPVICSMAMFSSDDNA